MSLSVDLDSQLVDVSHISLSELRTRCDPLLLDAIRDLVARIPLSDRDEIQEPGRPRPRMTDS